MDNEVDILARIRRVSAELSREALSINRPFLATLLDMAEAEARLDGERQTRAGQGDDAPGDETSKKPTGAPDTGT